MSQTEIFLAIEAKWNAVCPGQQPSLPLGLWPRWTVIKQGCAESAPHISAAATRTLSFIYAALRWLFCALIFTVIFFSFANTSLIHMSVFFMAIHLAVYKEGCWRVPAWLSYFMTKTHTNKINISLFPFSKHGCHIKKHICPHQTTEDAAASVCCFKFGIEILTTRFFWHFLLNK